MIWMLSCSFFYISDMFEKETVVADKQCSEALAYFHIMAQIREREYSVEMLCSKGYDTLWSINDDNWCTFVAFPTDDLECLN
jgi:hypothetical protein